MLSVARVTYIPWKILAVNVIAVYSRSPRLSSAGWLNVSKHRNLNRLAIDEQHHGLVARLREMAAEFRNSSGFVLNTCAIRRRFIGMPSVSF
jgi:hypothetical protein